MHGVSSLRNDERGAVVVLVAFLILPLALLLAFAIDTGNWWTHKRHLQTQADSGAFAAGQGPWFPTCDEATIETYAAAYSGGTYNAQYQPSGSVHVLLNSTNYYENGGANFSDTGRPCETLLNGGDTPAFVDVKATEADLANFFGSIPGFSSVTAHTHARVEIQGVQEEEGVRPIAVRNPSLYQCAHAQLWTTTSSGTLDSKLGPEFTAFSRTVLDDTSTQFQITGNATMPAKEDGESPHVAVQVILGNRDCAVTDTYADPPGTYGVDFINVYSNTVTVGDGHEPELGSVSMPPGLSSCKPDPYFAVKGCTAVVKAYVEFAPGAKTSNPGQNAFITINGVDAVAATDAGGTYWTASVPIQGESGPNPIQIDWRQKYGTIPDPPKPKPKDCSKGQGCEGSFDVAQQGFGATADEDETNSGDLKLVQVADQNGNFANSLIAGTPHSFTITVQVRGLENSKPTDPPTILRYSVQNSKRTGLVDCGQGNGSGDIDAIVNGCPLGVYIWPEGTSCVLPQNDPIDCVTPVPGDRRGQIVKAIRTRIDSDKTGYEPCGPGGNHWNDYRESNSFDIDKFIQPDDPRLLPLIITEPADFSGGAGNGPPIPVRAIATFYVTGYDGVDGDGQGCNNEPYPGKGSDKWKIWGHWIKYVPVGGGVGNGKGCDPKKFGDCIAVLTQ